MGCCLSTPNPTTAKPPNSSTTTNHHQQQQQHAVSKSPPRAEEEAVKEVLTETPISPTTLVLLPPPDPIPISTPINIPNPNPYYYTPLPKLNLHQHHQNNTTAETAKLPPPPLSPPSPTPDQISEASEISCISETVSTAVQPQIQKPTTGKSPVRRQNPSPRRTGPEVVRNRVGDEQRRRELGENSRRRSRSPVIRNDRLITGQSPSARKTGISPGRVRMVQHSKKEKESGWDDNPDPTLLLESLENPLVSLECFIFL